MEEARKPRCEPQRIQSYRRTMSSRLFLCARRRSSLTSEPVPTATRSASRRTAEPGRRVFALDAWEEARTGEERASLERLGNIETLLAGRERVHPLEDGTIDLCLGNGVLHDLLRDATGRPFSAKYSGS